jgi:membrane protease YdiL (CAAX protease family)
VELQMPAPIFEVPRRKNALLAAGLSGLVPGLGHAYLGDWKTAGGLMGGTGLGLGLAALSESHEAFQATSLITVQATSFYGIYAAYRDARIYNGQLGYSYKMPTDSLADLSSAPFRWSVIKKPEVWGGLIGSLALATAVGYFFFPEKSEAPAAAAISNPWFPIVALPIGIGEESFFRGFLMPQFSEWTTPWGGIALSSVVFGAMHIPNAMGLEPEDRRSYYTASLPLITALGAYCGWLTHKNHSLKESVALHTWYDFAIFAVSTFANQAMIKGPTGFSISIPL